MKALNIFLQTKLLILFFLMFSYPMVYLLIFLTRSILKALLYLLQVMIILLLNAFEHNGIDYLLKPVDEKDLGKDTGKV